MALTLADRVWIDAQATAAGFDVAGVTNVPDGDEAERDARRFADWIAAGHAGEMDYLKRVDHDGSFIRGDLRRSMPWARSVIVCALNYNADAPTSIAPADPHTGWIARYAWSGKQPGTEGAYQGADYHDVLLSRLQSIEAALHARFDSTGNTDPRGNTDATWDKHPAVVTRAYVDTGPLLERGYAVRAGVGWIGKNTCVLNQQQGSWMLLGVIVTSLELAPEAAAIPAADRCGSCTRCIDACPTEALIAPTAADGTRQMDASRCIAYLTIEKKGSIPEDLRLLMGRQVFGCDICQDVCPWNRRAPIASSGALRPRSELINPALAWLASLDGPSFNRIFRSSPLERTRRKRILRNVAVAMGNSGQQEFVPQLEAWAAGDDALLAEHAAWALKVKSQ